jgi:TrmH family RNA methyltransferase
MITIAKLRTLGDRTCVRKCALLFHQQAKLALRNQHDRAYLSALAGLFDSAQFQAVLAEDERSRLLTLGRKLGVVQGLDLAVTCDDIHYLLLQALGTDSADWDFIDELGNLDASRRTILDHILVLDRIRSPYNIGSIFRSADSFGIQKIYLIEGCAAVDHSRALKTSRGCTQTVEHEVIGEEAMLERLQALDFPLFALETGGTELDAFAFPSKGVAVIGSEELGVSPALLGASEASLGRLSIVQAGTKGSLNVAVAAGIMMHGWFTA